MTQSIWPIHTSTFVLLITLALQSTCIGTHPNCQPFSNIEGEIHSYFDFPSSGIDLTFPSEFSYIRALQNIVPSAQHIATRFATGNTGQWFSLLGVHMAYNNAAWPSNQNNIGTMDGRLDVFSLSLELLQRSKQILGFLGATTWSELMKADIDVMIYLALLQQVTSIDWNLQQSNSQNQKRAMSDYSIKINCQPELLKLNKYEDYRVGLYWDSTLREFHSNTPAMDECINNDAEGTTPMILVQKGAGGQQPSYTIFICPAAKFMFKGQYSVYNSLQLSLLGVTSATLRQEWSKGTSWNLGPSYSVNYFVFLDTMILAALMAIAQGQESYIITGPGRNTDLWAYCFQSQGANWNDPSEF